MLEILAPAGNMECAKAAIQAGANAVYLGFSSFSARQRVIQAKMSLRYRAMAARWSQDRFYVVF